MTWTCDKEDDCENGEDETHCSERQGGESKGLWDCCMGWQEQAQQRGKQEPLLSQDPLAKKQIPDSSSLWSYPTTTDLTVTKTNVLARFFAQQMHVSIVTLRMPSYSSFE